MAEIKVSICGACREVIPPEYRATVEVRLRKKGAGSSVLVATGAEVALLIPVHRVPCAEAVAAICCTPGAPWEMNVTIFAKPEAATPFARGGMNGRAL